MGGGVGDVEEERLIGVVFRVIAQEPDSVVGDGVGVVVGFGLVVGIGEGGDHGLVLDQGRRIEITPRAVDRAVEAVEAPGDRPVVLRPVGGGEPGDVPLAGHICAVSGRFEDFGQRAARLVQVASVARVTLVFHHVADPGLMGVQAGQQAGPGRAASGGVVELGEPHASRRQGVDVRRVDLASLAPDVREPHVIDQNQHHVRPLPPRRADGDQGQDQEGERGSEGAVEGHGEASYEHVTCRRGWIQSRMTSRGPTDLSPGARMQTILTRSSRTMNKAR